MLGRSNVTGSNVATTPVAARAPLRLPSSPRFPNSTPKDLAEKLYGSTLCQGSSRFKRPKLNQTAFVIDHYAGEG